MNKEEQSLAKKLGFDWIKIQKTKTKGNANVTVYNKDNIEFYIDMIPKFILHLVKSYKDIWISFLDDEAERLRVEVYALRNKHLNKKHGDFGKHHPLYGGVTKALEIDKNVQSKMAHVGEEPDIQKEINNRTAPFEHLVKPEDEEIFKTDVEGLGEVVGKVEEKEDDGRREEENRT